MNVECSSCKTSYCFYGNLAVPRSTSELNCPRCGLPMALKAQFPPWMPERSAGVHTCCAILSSGNRLRLFDIPNGR